MTRSRSDSFSETLIIRKRSRLLARAVAAIFACALLAQLLHTALAAAPAAAPDFVLPSSTGKNIRLSEYRSDVVAIAFVADWCGECSEQLRLLAQLQREHAAQGLQVLAVSFDRDAPTANVAASMPLLADPTGEVGKLFDIDDLPAVVVVDRAGRLSAVHDDGRLLDADALQAAILPLVSD